MNQKQIQPYIIPFFFVGFIIDMHYYMIKNILKLYTECMITFFSFSISLTKHFLATLITKSTK